MTSQTQYSWQFKHTVTISLDFDYAHISIMTKWCKEQLGTQHIYWIWEYNVDAGTIDFSFLQPEHATLFALKWV